MNPRYGYFSINEDLLTIWKRTMAYWSSIREIIIDGNSSFATEKYANLNLSRKRALKQAEQYYFKLAYEPDNKTTHIKIFIEYFGDSITGSVAPRMERTVNDWVESFNRPPVNFEKKPVSEYERFFQDVKEEHDTSPIKKAEMETIYCTYCGAKIKRAHKFCEQCGSKIELI